MVNGKFNLKKKSDQSNHKNIVWSFWFFHVGCIMSRKYNLSNNTSSTNNISWELPMKLHFSKGICLLSPSDETVCSSLCGSSEADATGKSSSRGITSLQLDMEDREPCGDSSLWGELSVHRGDGEPQGGEGDGERTGGLNWTLDKPVNLKGEPWHKGRAGERVGVVLEDDDSGTSAGGVEQTFWLLLLSIYETGM